MNQAHLAISLAKMLFIANFRARFMKRASVVAALLIAALMMGSNAWAQSETWSATTNGNWSTASNWNSGSGPAPGSTNALTNTNTATFNTSTGVIVTIDSASQNIGSLVFSGSTTGAFTIGGSGANGGNSLLLSSGGSITDSLTNSTATAETINAPLVLEPASSSTTGNYTFTNNASTVDLLNFAGNISGGSTSSTVTLTLGGTNGGANTISGVISNGSASGGLALTKTGTGLWELSASNSYTGATTVTGGNLEFTGAGSSANSAITVGTPGSNVATYLNIATTSSTPATTTYANGLTYDGSFANGQNFDNFNIVATSSTTNTVMNFGPLTLDLGSVNGSIASSTNYNTQLDFSSITRDPGSILYLGRSTTTIGTNTISSATANAVNIVFSTTPTLSGNNTVAGNGTNDGDGTPNVGILPYADLGTGNLVTYDTSKGLRALTSSELTTLTNNLSLGTGSAGQNALTANVTISTNTTVNALQGTSAATVSFGSDSTSLTVSSGAILAGSAGAGVVIGSGTVGSNGILNFGTAEGIIMVENARLFTINSSIQGSGGLTVNLDDYNGSTSTLVLNGTNTYTGVTRFEGNDGSLTVHLANGLALQDTTLDYNNYGATFTFGPQTSGSNAPTAYTFGGLEGSQNINLNNNNTAGFIGGVTLTVGGDNDANDVYSGVLSNTTNNGSLIKVGTGALTLSGANTYTGGTTLSAGQLNINNATALGGSAGAFTIDGGTTIDNTSGGAITLSNNNAQNWNGNFTFAGSNALNLGTGAVTLGQTEQVTVTTNTLTVGGVIGGGSFGLTKAGAGTLTLTGSNTFTGITSINNGTVSVNYVTTSNAAQPLGENAGLNLGNATTAGTLIYTGSASETLDKNISLGAAGGVLGDGNTTGQVTFTGDLIGSGNLTVANTQSVTPVVFLAGPNNSNSFTGNLIITYGTVRPFGPNGSGYTTTPLNANNVVAIASGAYFAMGTVGGTLTIAGLNDINGNDGGNFGGGTFNGTVTFGGSGTYSSSDTVSMFQNLAVSLTGSGLQTLSGNLSFNSANNTTGLTLNSGQLILSGSNSYLGATVLNSSANGSVLVADSASALSSGSITVKNGATLQLEGGYTTATNNALTLSGAGATGTTNTGTGALENLSGNNTYTGLITLGTNATISSDSNTLTLSNPGTITSSNFALTLGGAGNGTNEEIIAGTGTLIKSGGGAWTLTGANTYSGGTTVNGGTLIVGAGGTLGNSSSSALAVNGNGTVLDLSTSAATTVGSLNGTGASIIDNGGQLFTVNQTTTNTYAGTIQDTGGFALGGSSTAPLTLSGSNTFSGGLTVNAGTLILSGSNTYSGGNTVNAGTLQLSGSGTLGSTTNALTMAGGTLDLGATSQTIGAVGISGGTIQDGTLIVSGSNAISSTTSGTATISANLQGAGATLSQNGSGGVLYLSGTNTFTGATTIATGGGTIVYESSGAFDTSSAITVGNGGAVQLDPLSGNIVGGSQALSLFGSGGGNGSLESITGTNSFAGAITLTANSTIGSDTNSLTLSGGVSEGTHTLTTKGAGNITFSTVGITGTGTSGFIDNSTGIVTLSAPNSYTGTTSIAAGGDLVIAGSGDLGSGTYTKNIGDYGTFNYNSSTNQTLSGVISGSGALIQSGSGTLALSGTNTYSGSTTISGGLLSINSAPALGTGSNVFFNGGTSSAPNVLQYTGGNGTLSQLLTVNNLGYGLVDNTGGGVLTLAGGVSKNGSVFNLAGGKFVISAPITGSSNNSDVVLGSTTYTGTTTVGLTSTNNYNGPTTITAGSTLITGTNNAMPLTTPSALTLGAMTDASNSVNTFDLDGTTETVASINAISSTNGATTDQVINSNATISGSNVFSGAGANGNVGSLIVDYTNTGTNDVFSGSLGGSGASNNFGLTVTGGGTLVLSGTNTYTGSTTVSGGSTLLVTGSNTGSTNSTIGNGSFLNVQGSSASTGAVTVNSGGTLEGSGTAGTVLVQTGGVVAPGSGWTLGTNLTAGPGQTGSTNNILTAGSLTVSANSTLSYNLYHATASTGTALDAAGGTLIVLTGGFYGTGVSSTVGSQINLNLNYTASSGDVGSPNVYNLVEFSDVGGTNPLTNLTTSDFDIVDLSSVLANSSGTLQFTYLGNNLEALQLDVVPEPSTWAMFALGLGLLAYAVRRKLRLGRKTEVTVVGE